MPLVVSTEVDCCTPRARTPLFAMPARPHLRTSYLHWQADPLPAPHPHSLPSGSYVNPVSPALFLHVCRNVLEIHHLKSVPTPWTAFNLTCTSSLYPTSATAY